MNFRKNTNWLLILLLSFGVHAEEASKQSVNEISLGVTVSANGSLTFASGLHTALPKKSWNYR